MKHAGYKAVFFDAAGTLFKVYPSVGAVYAREARRYGCKADPEKLEKLFRAEFSRMDHLSPTSAHAGKRNEKEWWKELVRRVFEESEPVRNFDLFFEELYELFADKSVWHVFPEVRSVLKQLALRKVTMGVLSNFDERLHRVMSATGLAKYFKFVLASAEIGAAKPDPRIFEKALKLAHVKPDEAIHVGDSLAEDFEGARNAGVRALLLVRGKRYTRKPGHIPSLLDILKIV